MTPASKLSDLRETIIYVVAPTLADCIAAAESWAKENKVAVQRYYHQKFHSKFSVGIIADYVSVK